MTQIAFISDIHSNLPALESTINCIKDKGITQIYCLGDIIGYHSFTNEVIDLLKDNSVVSIKGNHDETITDMSFNRDKESDFVLYWNYDALTKENLEYIKSLPGSLEIKVEGITLNLVHGSPESITEYIREDSKTADKYIEAMSGDVLLCGHTHIPYIVEKDGKFLLNTGSVGKPKFGRPEASFIVLSINGESIKPEIISIPYDTKRMTDHLIQNKFPEKLINAIKTGLP